MRALHGLLASTVVALTLLLTGCAPGPGPVPEARELVGRWYDDGASLVLRSGGTGTAAKLFLQGRLVSGPCSWRVGNFSGDERAQDGSPVLALSFGPESTAPGYRVVLEVDGTGSSRTLVRSTDPELNEGFTLRR